MKKAIASAVFCVVAVALNGCASTARMIEHASLQAKVVMTDPVFLSLTAKERTAFIDVRNTSDLQGVMLAPALRDRLIKKNITLVDDPAPPCGS